MSKSYRNMNLDDFDEYGEYDDVVTFEKLRGGSKKKKSKGHQSRHQKNKYDEYDSYDEIVSELPTVPVIPQTVVQNPVDTERGTSPDASKTVQTGNHASHLTTERHELVKKPFEFGPNTHELMGNKIDYDRVANLETIESEYKGKQTFGIKFTFKGKNASTRVIWYNQHQRERDMIFAQEYKFWLSVRTAN